MMAVSLQLWGLIVYIHKTSSQLAIHFTWWQLLTCSQTFRHLKMCQALCCISTLYQLSASQYWGLKTGVLLSMTYRCVDSCLTYLRFIRKLSESFWRTTSSTVEDLLQRTSSDGFTNISRSERKRWNYSLSNWVWVPAVACLLYVYETLKNFSPKWEIMTA